MAFTDKTLNTISPSSSYRRYDGPRKSVLTPEGKSILSNSQMIETNKIDNGWNGSTTTTDITNYTYGDMQGRKYSDIYSGNQEDILKNLEKRKSLLSQGIGAGKSLLGGAVI